MSFLRKIFGDANEKYLKSIQSMIEQINDLEQKFESFSDEQLKEQTSEFKKELKKRTALRGRQKNTALGGRYNEVLDSILPQAFALVREASKRTLQQRPFDTQLIGGIVLYQGKIAQMVTGEGKTLAATLPAYLNALSGNGVHIITVNDYLSKRDTVWMGQIYYALGISVGCINHDISFLYDPEFKKPDDEKDKIRDEFGAFKIVEDFLRPCSRKQAYLADITYGTNNEFGFDFLRNNMAHSIETQVQKQLNFAILDEIDFILIDEARTPLIISAPDVKASEMYNKFSRLIPKLKKDLDFEIDEEKRTAVLTEQGIQRTEEILGLKDIYETGNIDYIYHLEQALKSFVLFKKDTDYVVKNNEVIIVDEFTGRLMPGRRWSGGLHQAVEAKENVEIQPESRTLATITFQNYFRLYKKMCGMTGTAITSAEEFDKVYGLDVIAIPTNMPMQRRNLSDGVYKSEIGKLRALIKEIKQRHQKGQPILIGTRSIEKNEILSKFLQKQGLEHQVLNAKNHEKEAQIFAQAGKLGAITVATNMAGRGVDIVLGGNPPEPEQAEKIKKMGGLHVIGTERHEARRIDDQLRGRAGRQGDPGSNQFFLCLDDDLLRIFGGDRIKGLMEKLNISEDEPITANLISKAVESAQAKIEGMHFDVRKNLLDYDDVMSKHRNVFYDKRKKILLSLPEELKKMLTNIWVNANLREQDFLKKEQEIGENFLKICKLYFLSTMDSYWMRHLEDMSWLRESVRLKAYGNINPLVEYKTQGYMIFQEMMDEIEQALFKTILRIRSLKDPNNQVGPEKQLLRTNKDVESITPKKRIISKKTAEKIGRNQPCPCGRVDTRTGKRLKHKKCCGSATK